MDTIKKLDESMIMPEKLQTAESVLKNIFSPFIGAAIAFVTVFTILLALNFFVQRFDNSGSGILHSIDLITAAIVALIVAIIKVLEKFRH